jgi:hypothetical protein
LTHIIRSHYHRDVARAGRYIHYISHREEHLPRGQRREIHGIGERYKEVARLVPDALDRERACQRLIQEDAQQLRRPVFHQPVFTVDDRAAAELAKLPRVAAERELSGTFTRAMRGTVVGRHVQGVYAIHWHGGDRRPAHPHIHALLSPLRRDGQSLYLSKDGLRALWGAWTREVERGALHRQAQARRLLPSRVSGPRIDSWVRGTAVAQAIRQAHFPRQLDRGPLAMATKAASLTPVVAKFLPAATVAAKLARDPLPTLLRLAAETALRPLPRPVAAIARALYGLSRTLRPEP